MRRFVEGTDRGQSALFPECLEDWIGEDNPVRVIDVFAAELDLAELGFSGVDPEVTGRPSYHPSVLLKLYIYGYLNRVQSSRRLERIRRQDNVERRKDRTRSIEQRLSDGLRCPQHFLDLKRRPRRPTMQGTHNGFKNPSARSCDERTHHPHRQYRSADQLDHVLL